MEKIEFGITAGEIMQTDFPVIEASLTLEDCMKKLNRQHEACMILHEGTVHSVLSYDDLLRAFLSRKKKDAKIEEFEPSDNFILVHSETDMFEVIRMLRQSEADFVLVKDGNSMGLITKREIAEINQTLFDVILSKTSEIVG